MFEARHPLRIAGEDVGKELQGYFAVEGKVLCQIDLAHTTLTDFLHNFIVRDGLTDLGHAILQIEGLLQSF